MRKLLLALGWSFALLQAGHAVCQDSNEYHDENKQRQAADLSPTKSTRTTLFKCKKGETTVFSDKPCQADLQKQETVTVRPNDPIDNSGLREKISLENQGNIDTHDASSKGNRSSGQAVHLGDSATTERNARLSGERKSPPAATRNNQQQNSPIFIPANNNVPVQLVNCTQSGCDGTNGVRYVDVGGGNYLNTQTGQVQKPTN